MLVWWFSAELVQAVSLANKLRCGVGKCFDIALVDMTFFKFYLFLWFVKQIALEIKTLKKIGQFVDPILPSRNW